MIETGVKGQQDDGRELRRRRLRSAGIGFATIVAASATVFAATPGSAAAQNNVDKNIINKRDVIPLMKRVAPLSPSARVDGYPALDSDNRQWYLGMGEGEKLRTSEQNNNIEGSLKSIGGATVNKRLMDPMLMRNKCSGLAKCGFVGALQTGKEYPAITTGDTTSGNPIRFDKSTSVARSSSSTIGYTVGVESSVGPNGGQTKGTFQVNASQSSSLTLTGGETTSNTYTNAGQGPVYIEARANAGWYTGYITITEQKVTTAIPARVLVTSSATKSPVTWNAVHADSS